MLATPWLTILKRWTHYGILILAVILLWARSEHWQDKAEQCEIGRKADRAAYEAAQREAEAKAIADKAAREAESRKQAERTDHELESLRAQVRDANARYIASHSVRIKAASGAASGTVAPTDDHSPEGPERAGPDAVVVGRHDFDILVDNTLRLEAAHQWAKTLNVEPMPDPAF